jgi:hypothetical protein
MSHQDTVGDTSSGFNHQDLRRSLEWLSTGADFTAIRFREDCSWTPRGLVFAAILWAWSDVNALTRRARLARKIAITMGIQSAVPATTYQAFLKILQTWTKALSQTLMDAFRLRMQTCLESRFRLHGFALFGVDGSRNELPRTASNERRFSPPSVKPATKPVGPDTCRARAKQRHAQNAAAKKANSPQLWLTTLLHLGTGLPWDWRLGPSNSSERGHLLEMLAILVAGSLVVADAGFVGYAVWRALQAAGHHFVIRVGANIKLLEGLGRYRKKTKKGLVYLWPNEAMGKGLPPLVLRLVTIEGGTETIYLITSVLDATRLGDEALREIYRMRWGIELFYRHFKQTYERSKLRSRKAEHVMLEATWSLLGLWAMMLTTEVALLRDGVPANKISIAGMFHAFHTAIREYKSTPDPSESLCELLSVAVIDSYTRANKTSRDYPRKKQRQKIGAPEIQAASEIQIEAAQNLSDQQWLRLTA